MSDDVMKQFQQREAESIALSVKFNRWSRTMVGVMIEEKERKLVASDQPVDDESQDDFWSDLG